MPAVPGLPGVVLALGTLRGSGAVERVHGVLRRGAPWIAAAVAMAVVAGVAVTWMRHVSVRRALADRLRLALLPADGFDPNPEEISRYGFQLTRTRRAVRGAWTRPASAVRISLRCEGGGRMSYEVAGSRRVESILRLGGGYSQVEVVSAESVASAPTWPHVSGGMGDENAPENPDGGRRTADKEGEAS